MIKNIIFDFGGVMHDVSSLTEERENIHKALKIKEGDEELEKIRLEAVSRLGSGQLNEQEYWQELSSKFSIPIPENHHELHRAALRDHSDPYPQMFDLVECLKEAGYNVFVLSNSIPPHAEVLRAKGWYDSFHRVLLSQDLGHNKPDKRIFEKALQKLNIKADETLFIDDRKENLVPARELGMNTLLAHSPDRTVIE